MAVIGGGPAGSLFSYFLLTMAERVGIDLHVDIYEPRDFSRPGPVGCNMCGGVVSESMVQLLSAEGIKLPATKVLGSLLSGVPEAPLPIDAPAATTAVGWISAGQTKPLLARISKIFNRTATLPIPPTALAASRTPRLYHSARSSTCPVGQHDP